MSLALSPFANLFNVGRFHLNQLVKGVRNEHLLQRFGQLNLGSNATVLVNIDNQQNDGGLRVTLPRSFYDDLQREERDADTNDHSARM